jgi:membrane-associated protein
MQEIIIQFGYIGIFLTVFAESGILFGFFLPGDTLLFAAGLLALKGTFSLPLILLTIFTAAVLGDSVGYLIGKKYGKKLFKQEESLFFKKEYLEQSQAFFKKNGSLAIILARFVPIVRTFAPVLAGVSDMNYRTFVLYNIVGGAVWTLSITLAGYFLGSVIPNIDHYIFPIIGFVVLFSVGMSLKELFHHSKKKSKKQN